MSDHASPNDDAGPLRAADRWATLASLTKELGLLTLAAVWAIMWVALTIQTLEAEGAVNAVIIGVYSLLPVVLFVGWRLAERTSFDPPTLGDLISPDEVDTADPGGSSSGVGNRYTVGQE